MAIQKLEPFGSGNPQPVFATRDVKLIQPARMLKEKHIKLRAIPGDANANGGRFQRAHDVMGWRMADRAARDPLLAGDILDVAFTVDYNEHPEFGGVQLNLVDFARTAPLVSTAVADG